MLNRVEADRLVRPAIRVSRLCKSYKMYDAPRDLLIEALTGRKRHREKSVLRDIDFEIPRGEVVGIIGQNGAGKSTLLKIIAGTLKPTTGSVDVDGRIAAILELGTGFNPNYTGRENVVVSGMLRGMTEQQVRAKLGSIIAFSGLEHVIDEPFHTYSSGMQARLAFATAVSVDADVIIIDEALAAGDVRFASRSLRRIREISQSGVTCLFVSHVTYQIMQLCSRAIWIDQGRVRMDGPAIEVVRAYEYEMHELIARDLGQSESETIKEEPPPALEPLQTTSVPVSENAAEESMITEGDVLVSGETSGSVAPDDGPVAVMEDSNRPAEPDTDSAHETEADHTVEERALAISPYRLPENPERLHVQSGRYRICRVRYLNAAGAESSIFRFGEILRLQVAYRCLSSAQAEPECGLVAAFNRTSDFEAVMYLNSSFGRHRHDSISERFNAQAGVLEATLEPLQLTAGEYYVSVGIIPNSGTAQEFYEYIHCHSKLVVLPNGFNEPSVFYPLVSWSNGPDLQ